jgi:hypothetical protein
MPILRKTNEKLNEQITALRSDVTRTQALLEQAQLSMEEFRLYHEADSKRQYERALATLKADKRAALNDQNTDLVMEIDDAIQELGAGPKPLPKLDLIKPDAPDPSKDPVFVEWAEEHADWYGGNQEQTAYANSIGQWLRTMEPKLTGRPFLDKVAAEVKEKFGNGRSSDRVEGSRGGSTSQRSSGRSYADLPAADKAACDRFATRLVGEGKAFKTQAEWRKRYVADYFGEEA